MGSFSPIHLLVLAVVAILLLGGGRFSSLMGDVAKGVKNFKKGMAEQDDDTKPAKRIESQKQAEPAFDRDGNATRDTLRDDR
ncbi:Sec-independent protein translocase subunit TatA [Microvirga sp. SRT01]|jgi:sec-independent protein translocase protein TatA|uniref:Sec-independent protein translocase protein TatA n=1 Tax=Sphingomonas longa TaxID=2778730 RepID=A0ABS2D3T8_9SPHN|nr:MULTISPECIES: Sec-independent protein translocase subunit TatA [Alphaproteobacteria]MBM6575576.1 Sec-independent protein translocase subunit TatA [Sphingomonas sp. BT552]MBR7708624.1 Sec-independent protein translocase subunit TatA [Microvirga sp. SRT01]